MGTPASWSSSTRWSPPATYTVPALHCPGVDPTIGQPGWLAASFAYLLQRPAGTDAQGKALIELGVCAYGELAGFGDSSDCTNDGCTGSCVGGSVGLG
ncbi:MULTISPECIES: hypothetical protein, partial [unclassified Frankia]|uniref:hypothetical protein n=1 Tax=unclassified Frankia TaxID=2632575 RepID=UPI002AD2F4D6